MRYETKCEVCGKRKATHVRRLKRKPHWHIPEPHECAQAECCAECWRRIYERMGDRPADLPALSRPKHLRLPLAAPLHWYADTLVDPYKLDWWT
jgi:hypothetical protein